MVHYEPVMITIDIPGLVKVIINVIIRYHRVPESIIIDQSLLFISKFWFLLCYFLGIKKRLFIAFHPQTNGLTEKRTSEYSLIENNTTG